MNTMDVSNKIIQNFADKKKNLLSGASRWKRKNGTKQ